MRGRLRVVDIRRPPLWHMHSEAPPMTPEHVADYLEALRAGPGWYEFVKRPEATTHVAYVHENGEAWVPDTGWTTAGEFALLTEGGEQRLISLADVLALLGDAYGRGRDDEAAGVPTESGRPR